MFFIYMVKTLIKKYQSKITNKNIINHINFKLKL